MNFTMHMPLATLGLLATTALAQAQTGAPQSDAPSASPAAEAASMPPPAAPTLAPPGEPRPPLPRWELGAVAFGARQPAYPGAETSTQRALVLPYLIYRGEVLRSDRGSVGLRAVKTATFELDIGFAASLGSSADNVPARRGMADIGMLVEAGPKLKINLSDVADGPGSSRIELPLRGVFDLDDDLQPRGVAFEPAWVASYRLPDRWTVSTSLGAMVASRKLNALFYEVRPSEVTATRPVYQAEAGLVAWRASLSFSRPLGRDLRVFAYLRQDSLAGAANRDSPLVKRNGGTTASIGLSWTLMRSERSAVD
jgi:outer membrane scaffolding protein for murein synthesis (MipA/OmpV family)